MPSGNFDVSRQIAASQPGGTASFGFGPNARVSRRERKAVLTWLECAMFTGMRKLSNSSSKGLALLRGINIGGKRMLPMKDLAAIFTAAGCSDVRTYIQSGNVIFSAAPTVSKGLSGLITAEIEQRFGHRVPVILRTFEEMEQTICDNPFLKVGASEEALHVYFLANTPNAAAARSLDPDRSPPDAFQVVNRDVYVHLPAWGAQSSPTATSIPNSRPRVPRETGVPCSSCLN